MWGGECERAWDFLGELLGLCLYWREFCCFAGCELAVYLDGLPERL